MAMDTTAVEGRRAMDAYRKALATAASAAAYAVMARSMARELLPEELRAAARWAAASLRARLGWGGGDGERRTLVVRSSGGDGAREENLLFDAAREYLASKLDPGAMPRLGLTLARTKDAGSGRAGWRTRLFVEPGDSTVDVFEGVEFTWTCVETPRGGGGKSKGGAGKGGGGEAGAGGDLEFRLELSFDARHAATAMDRYVPHVMGAAEEAEQRDRRLNICMNEARHWYRMSHHHPATFDTLAMDPDLKKSIVADLDLFTTRREHYRRIGKAWKRGYLLHGPPGTGKSSLVAAMANHLRYHLYDLDLSLVHSNTELQWLLLCMPNKSILVIEDIDCCCDTMSREGETKKSNKPVSAAQNEDDGGDGDAASSDSSTMHAAPAKPKSIENKVRKSFAFVPSFRSHGLVSASKLTANVSSSITCVFFTHILMRTARGSFQVTLSGLLNLIDGLWSTSGEERVIVFTTNYKERLDPALLRPGRMDMHIYMGYCCWEAFKTLAKNYFLLDDHPLFPEIQDLLSEVEVTPADVSEMLLRSDDADIALQGLTELLKEKKQGK
ncbi:hypothetical protein PR202_gb20982 [Eleusine coracana subsp. coracana]|uniref:AAA+ ATPase domain-containing protein n=1 Tax=Eleusine coracana subsp. coracana TaxID=191504 RepID=A0AAV5FCT7_ELECO|nr:hypothetical protein PR202_gb20982 [Eleusine coracana subsp. coracana]